MCEIPAWHGHEMLFGYTLAVVAGFLLTAVRNWTGKPTPAGAPLIALAALWVAGRVLVLTPFASRGRDRQCGVSGGRRHRDRHPHRAEPEPAKLFLHRAAAAARPRRARVPSCPSGHAPVAGAGEPAGRPRCRPVHPGRDGRTGDSDVHQQRHAGRESHAAAVGRKTRAGRRARPARGRPAAGSRSGHCRGRAARCRCPRRTALSLAAVADARRADRVGPARGLRLDRHLSRAARTCRDRLRRRTACAFMR